MAQEITVPALIVLIGPSGSGKTTWARERFPDHSIVSSDELRGMVGLGQWDQKAGADSFELLEKIVAARLKRGLTTVIDTLGIEPTSRQRWTGAAKTATVPSYAVVFDTPAAECRRRNKVRSKSVPPSAMRQQITRYEAQRPTINQDGFGDVIVAEDGVRVVNRAMARATAGSAAQRNDPIRMDFGPQISSFEFDGHPATTTAHLTAIAQAAENAGFTSLWVMDHFLQIPQVGREWNDLPESYTTLAFLAGVTKSITLGTMVTGVGYRNPAHLGKIIATLDVLSGGRAACGLGAGWYEKEAVAYGWPFESVNQRLDKLEDMLQMLPLLWGPGSPRFEGTTFSIPEAICYPRPLQDRIPILVGGGGEKRTLRLVARYADMTNLFGDADAVRHKLDVLDHHCTEVGRDRSEITVTHLAPALVGSDDPDVSSRVGELTPPNQSADEIAASLNAGTVDDHIGRLRTLAEAGVQTEIVGLPNLDTDGVEAIKRFAPIIKAFGT